jgi:glycosyltransferase involved in cell wall biosynthesis
MRGRAGPPGDPPARRHRGARNAGIAAARAPFVAFHDSDDTALPGRLAVPVAYLQANPEVDVVIQNGIMLPPEGDAAGEETPWIAPPSRGRWPAA